MSSSSTSIAQEDAATSTTLSSYRRLDTLGYASHVGAAICAFWELVEELDQLNNGQGVLLLLLSRVCRELQSLSGAVSKSEEDLEHAGLCGRVRNWRDTVATFLPLRLLAFLLAVGGLTASLVDTIALDGSDDLAAMGVILLALNDVMEMVEESQQWLESPWRHPVHSVILLGATVCGVLEAVLDWGSSGGLGAEFAVIILSVSKILSYLGMIFDKIKEDVIEEEKETDNKSKRLLASQTELV